MKSKSLKFKLVLLFLIVGITPFMTISIVSYTKSNTAIHEMATNKLIAVRDIKKAQIEGYVNSTMSELRVLKDNPLTAEAMLAFNKAFEDAGDKVLTPEWNAAAAIHDASLKDLVADYGWYDIFLIHTDGDIVYTACRESDLGMIIPDSELKDSALGKAFYQAEKMADESVSFADFEPYSPSGGIPAAFMAARVHGKDGKLLGYVAMQVPLEKINDIMTQRSGMGETGESYLVGSDLRMRSDSFLDPDNHSVAASFAGTLQKNGVDTEAAHQAIKGVTDAKSILDYNGNHVLSAYTQINVGDTKWALISEMDEAEAFAAINQIKWIMLTIAALGTAVIITVALMVASSIAGPLGKIIAGLSESAHQTTTASSQVSSASQSLAEGAAEAASSLEETAANLEQMTSMATKNAENTQQAQKSSLANSNAVSQGTSAMSKMSQAISDIKTSSDETAKIVKTIDEIAFQTNLLALNAAVEAARAGEAGKGFAVVAEEVRNLAQRAGDAARNTAELIEESVKNSDNGVAISEEVARILQTIAEGNDNVNSLVSEISEAGENQKQGVQQINDAISQIDQVTQANAANAEESASAAEELSAQATDMNHMVAELTKIVNGANAKSSFSMGSSVAQAPGVARKMTATSKTGRRVPSIPMNKNEELYQTEDRELATF